LEVGRLELEDFRNYRHETLELSSGLNLVIGRNAQGKTNLLEAVYCLSGLGSPRSPDSALVREGAERALLHAQITRGERKVDLDLELRPGRGTRALVNKARVSGTKALGELAVSVFFGPDELSLVKGSPDGRRRFLDDLIVKMRPAQGAVRREWERVLRQRNALLKSMVRGRPAGGPEDTLEVWDAALCRAGAALGAARLRSLTQLLPYAAKRYNAIAGQGTLLLSYVSSWIPEEYRQAVLAGAREPSEDDLAIFLAARLDEVRMRELERRLSLAGPQRDDILVALGDPDGGEVLEARTYASQGDQRTAALALKLGEHDLLSDVLGEEPILLLDDVFSELDPSRREWLRDAVGGVGQTLVSSADSQPADALDAARVIEVQGGRVTIR
jgi:DNA replication and repair protein RecF